MPLADARELRARVRPTRATRASLNALAALRDRRRHGDQPIAVAEHWHDATRVDSMSPADSSSLGLSACATCRSSASTNGGSVIRGFIVSGSNSTPMRSFDTAVGRSERQQRQAPDRSLVAPGRQLAIDAERQRHRLAAPLHQLAAHERKDVVGVEVLALEHARPHRPQPARERTARPGSATERR